MIKNLLAMFLRLNLFDDMKLEVRISTLNIDEVHKGSQFSFAFHLHSFIFEGLSVWCSLLSENHTLNKCSVE